MERVKAKKHLGQHFLKDLRIAESTAAALTGHMNTTHVVEVGPGMGVLTDFLLLKQDIFLTLIELDQESIRYLVQKYPKLEPQIRHEDFLKANLQELQPHPLAIVGNFPYNISSQLFFKALENRDCVTEVVGMLQKEVAQRLAAPKGSRTYGILSVLLQAFYVVEYLFEVPPEVFVPPPKVQSAVIRARRNGVQALDCDEKLFVRVVKQAFSTRRKTLRNALKPMGLSEELKSDPQLDLRAEQLDVSEFISLTNKIQASWNQ
ncbi:16S rRNA (adenine(1518)-N(6)/adenine(1519)-N(6))-dimethyltransferase RsmA [Pleomorphovibrio marinus]|uniref:16S rRNA (adenine(1518)-N(6)/adenine(1519)-N(6))- dimethyltransferase RsmA n=1 Tax=Pleomorphovibrio marinus TaxID=2164132 RepID=UPI000E0B6A54|nr:16S rRNA (adenine(1518)-N(6)/adenine(1519)-N(6))-dimethyltransferase RsmA [Pleomorphovibrio marinus]